MAAACHRGPELGELCLAHPGSGLVEYFLCGCPRVHILLIHNVCIVQVLACEVLWTPQDENDYYTRDDIIHDYPTLNNL